MNESRGKDRWERERSKTRVWETKRGRWDKEKGNVRGGSGKGPRETEGKGTG